MLNIKTVGKHEISRKKLDFSWTVYPTFKSVFECCEFEDVLHVDMFDTIYIFTLHELDMKSTLFCLFICVGMYVLLLYFFSLALIFKI